MTKNNKQMIFSELNCIQLRNFKIQRYCVNEPELSTKIIRGITDDVS